MNLVKIEIPFAGFYETHHDNAIDDELEQTFSYDYETDEQIECSDIWEADIDYAAMKSEYCENYVEAFADKFSLTLTFDEMTSPREYNFTSDRLFCNIPQNEIDKIRKEAEAHADYPKYIEDNFTSRSGFWSNYSSDYKDEQWTREILDECQYEKIIRFWLDNISTEVGDEGWAMEEYYLTERFEMCNWDSIQTAVASIEKHLKEKESDKNVRS